MRKPLLFVALFVTLLLASQEAPIRVQVQLVNVLATARDTTGALNSDLNKEDFTILDEGRPQEIRVFDRQAGTPLAITLLVDCSGSTAKDLRFEQESASKFLHGLLRKQDRAALYAFNHFVDQVVDFTNDPARLDRGL